MLPEPLLAAVLRLPILHCIHVPRSHTMLKLAIFLLLLAMLASLFSGLFFLVRDEGRTSRLANSLALRALLAGLTVSLIAWGFHSGQLLTPGAA